MTGVPLYFLAKSITRIALDHTQKTNSGQKGDSLGLKPHRYEADSKGKREGVDARKNSLGRGTDEECRRYEVYHELEELVSEMNYTVDAVVIEGPHDRRTLNRLGYRKPILLCSKVSHSELVDLISEKFSNVVVLTDFDEEGVQLNRRLSKLLERRGVKVDRFYRRRFRRLLKEARISTIEAIYGLKLELF